MLEATSGGSFSAAASTTAAAVAAAGVAGTGEHATPSMALVTPAPQQGFSGAARSGSGFIRAVSGALPGSVVVAGPSSNPQMPQHPPSRRASAGAGLLGPSSLTARSTSAVRVQVEGEPAVRAHARRESAVQQEGDDAGLPQEGSPHVLFMSDDLEDAFEVASVDTPRWVGGIGGGLVALVVGWWHRWWVGGIGGG